MNIRRIVAFVVCVFILLGAVGCSEGAYDNKIKSNEAYLSEEIISDAESLSKLPENRKLIQTVNMWVETENLDTVLNQIDSRIAELGGYTEKSDIQNGSAYSGARYRSANVTVRIPAKDLDSFIDKIGEVTNIVSSEKKVEDVTLNYVATESRMKALQAEETRLLELMSGAETMDDLLTIEKRLTEVRTELEQVTSALRVFDNQIDYATICLNIEEVKEYTDVSEPKSVWERIGNGLKKSLKSVGNFLVEFFVFVIVSIPYVLLIAVVPAVVLLIIWINKRKKNKKRTEEEKRKNDNLQD
ncbi:MAG: DUF4349 domain-containing protein [Ruminococcaceae bacterium]|nr:DUF4349 domain-containing protein [Oscillospiraceae bacterium]